MSSERPLLLRTLACEETKKVPIWFMRQAGRYLPEYQELRKRYSFWNLLTNSELATKVTLQPIERFNLDAAVIFSDIMTLLHGLGVPVSFAQGAPTIQSPIQKPDDVTNWLTEPTQYQESIETNLNFLWQELETVRRNLSDEQAVIGFAAAPFTLASYLIEAETSKNHAKTRAWMYSHQEAFDQLLDKIRQASEFYLRRQHQAGADVVQLFDSWADILPEPIYEQYILPHVSRLIQNVSSEVPVIYFSRGASLHASVLPRLYEDGLAALSVDWRIPLTAFGTRPIQGNLDPAYLFAEPEDVRKATQQLLQTRGTQPGYIFNLGHGVLPGARLESVEAMVDAVQQFNRSS